HEWWVDCDQAAATERALRGGCSDRELGAQNLVDTCALEPARERIRLLPALDRVPEQVDSARPLAVRGLKSVRELDEIARVLERRSDPPPPAPLGGRHISVGRDPPADRDRFAALVAREIARRRGGGRRLEPAGDEPVLRPDEGARERR